MDDIVITDEIYGIGIQEYLDIHETTIDELIKNVIIDINLLEKNFRKEVFENEIRNIELVNNIYDKLIKKKNRLKRLKSFQSVSSNKKDPV